MFKETLEEFLKQPVEDFRISREISETIPKEVFVEILEEPLKKFSEWIPDRFLGGISEGIPGLISLRISLEEILINIRRRFCNRIHAEISGGIVT